ncbi:MAG: hypothetical protein R3A52_22415 [Polyangiales bacterium]
MHDPGGVDGADDAREGLGDGEEFCDGERRPAEAAGEGERAEVFFDEGGRAVEAGEGVRAHHAVDGEGAQDVVLVAQGRLGAGRALDHGLHDHGHVVAGAPAAEHAVAAARVDDLERHESRFAVHRSGPQGIDGADATADRAAVAAPRADVL